MNEANWLSVKEGSLICYELGLSRSPKSIRRWCASGDIEAEKRPNGKTDQWFINRESLEIKINEELEFLKQSGRSLSSGQPNSDMSTHDRTQANVSAHERSQADMPGRDRTQADNTKYGAEMRDDRDAPQGSSDLTSRIRQLENDNMLLKIDVGWRDKLIEQIQDEKKIALENQHAQARYIGHLESELLRLDGKPDQSFLAAPTPVERADETAAVEPEVVQPERPHPDQQTFYGHRAA